MDNAKFVEEGNPHDLLLSKLDSKQLEVYHRIYQEIENKILKNDKGCIENFDKRINKWYEEEFDWSLDDNGNRILTEEDISTVFVVLLNVFIGWIYKDFENADTGKFDVIYCEVDECMLYPKVYLPERATTEMYSYDSGDYYTYEGLSFVVAEEPDTREEFHYDEYWKWGSIGIYISKDTEAILLNDTTDDTYTIVSISGGSHSGSMSDIRLE